jgi:hypothetical protein
MLRNFIVNFGELSKLKNLLGLPKLRKKYFVKTNFAKPENLGLR